MIILAATNHVIELNTSASGDIDVLAEWLDFDGVDSTPGQTTTTITGSGDTTIVSAPAASQYRNVVQLTIANRHASVANAVIVSKDVGGTEFDYIGVTLQPGEVLQHNDRGWTVLDATGATKVSYTDPRLITRKLAAQHDNSTTTATEVTGLTEPLGVGVYQFEYHLIYQSGTAGTGIGVSVNFDGTFTDLSYFAEIVSANSAASDGAADQDVQTAAMGLLNADAGRTGTTAGALLTASVDTINSDMLMVIRGTLTVSVAGNIELWRRSETAVLTSLMVNSNLKITKM